ncbi:Peroxide stress-activated histidine kinase mak1 [Colletotrichum sp. SAR 10_76]|nr:Peroxide stress-activated histidine kinase mak1 [Colletotrichum sp. SAR 10_76]
MPGGKPTKASIESARERETFRYDTTLIPASRKNDPANLIPPSELRASSDASLTAFAQLGALRLGASRALISLFDTKCQYIVAEATPNLLLAPNATPDTDAGEQLWLCGTALPRAHGVCESVLVAPGTAEPKASEDDALPVSVISDLADDPRSSEKAHYKEWPHPRFYAGVPIKSRRGVSIGVFSIWSDEPRQELSSNSTQLLRQLSRMVTDHLDSKRTVERHHRASSDFSEEDGATPMSPLAEKKLSTAHQEELSPAELSDRARKRNKKLLSRQNEGKMLMTLFSGARSVALVPLWDAQKQRWYSGGFVYTKTANRVLTIEGELSYLRAFGTVIMSEVAKHNARMVDKAKSDLLSSLSHELRSPLHGILLGAELMQDTPLDAFQGDVLHSVETCGKTLLDTMDHLLDYSKLGNFLRPTVGRQNSASGTEDRGLRTSDKNHNIEAGMMSLSRNVNIDVLAEEVIESIILNILGNALKYTTRGFINVNVLQVESSIQGSREIQIVVADSGKGMSEDYLRYHLYAPFHQEDTLSAGTGVGLSLVKEVVTRLGGSIQVQSKVNRGTKVTVKLPLQQASPPSPKTSIPKTVNFDEFRAQVSELKGLRVRLLGFPTRIGTNIEDELSANVLSEHALLEGLCREWLQMHVIDESSLDKLLPDLILATERNLDRLLYERRHHGVSTPVVVVCRNALIARQLATSPRFTGRRVVFEFVSQPIGPRKLARILLLSFRRWTKLQASAIMTPTALSLASAEPGRFDGKSRLESRDFQSTSAMSTEAIPDKTEYFGATDVAATYSTDTIKQAETEEDKTMTLPERPGPRSSTPTPGNPEPRQSPNESDRDPDLFLLVDDNAINLRILSEYMKKLGHKYTTAMDGKQAVEAFRKSEGRYKCIFMDISMPVMDGFEATREIRVFETRKNIPRCQVFALTGLASASAQEEAFASGIDLFLTKPVKLKELSKILQTRDLA